MTMDYMARISWLLIFLSFLTSSVLSDQLMFGRSDFGQAGVAVGQSSLQQGPVCAECVEKDSLNVVRVVTKTGRGQGFQQDSQDAMSLLGGLGGQDRANLIQPTSPQLITTTIYETFPTVFNGFSITGKRTRISVFYAAQATVTAQAVEAGRQLLQQDNNDISNRMISPNVFQKNPGQLQVYYYSSQAHPDQRSDLMDSVTSASQSSSQFQQMANGGSAGQTNQLDSSHEVQAVSNVQDGTALSNGQAFRPLPAATGFTLPSQVSQANLVQPVSSSGDNIRVLNAVSSASANNGQFVSGSASPALFSNAQSQSQSQGMATGFQPLTNANQFGGTLGNNQNPMLPSSSSQGGEAGASSAGSPNPVLPISDSHFQGFSPQPTQNFAVLADSLAQSNGRQASGTYQSLSAYSIEGTDGFVTMGQATFVAASAGAAFSTVTDLRTVSPTITQPVGSFMTSTSRLEAFFVPIGNTRLRGERTRYSYYYALPGSSGDTRIGRISAFSTQMDSQSRLTTATSVLLQPTPLLTSLPSVNGNVQTVQNQNQNQNSLANVVILGGQTTSTDTSLNLSSVDSGIGQGLNNSFAAATANQLDGSPITSSPPTNVQLQADTRAPADAVGITFQSNGKGFMRIFQKSNSTERQSSSLSSQDSARLALVSKSNQLPTTTITSALNSTSKQDLALPANTNGPVLAGANAQLQGLNTGNEGLTGASQDFSSDGSRSSSNVDVNPKLESGQALTSAGSSVNLASSSQQGVQRFTSADAGTNEQSNLNNLDSIYNPTYSSNSGSRAAGSIFGTYPPTLSSAESRADTRSVSKTATSNDTTGQLQASNGVIQLFSLNNNNNAIRKSGSNVNQFTLLDLKNGGMSKQNVAVVAVEPFAVSSFSQGQGAKPQAAGGASSSSSNQGFNSAVQSSISFSNQGNGQIGQ